MIVRPASLQLLSWSWRERVLCARISLSILFLFSVKVFLTKFYVIV